MTLKKYLTVAVAGVAAASMVGCSNNKKYEGMVEQEYVDGKWVPKEESVANNVGEPSDEEIMKALAKYVESQNKSFNTLLINDQYMTMYLTGVNNGTLGVEMWFEVTNNTDVPIRVQSRDVSVDGYMENTIMSIDVMPGKTARDRMIFRNINNVNDLKNVEGKFWLALNGYLGDKYTYDFELLTDQ